MRHVLRPLLLTAGLVVAPLPGLAQTPPHAMDPAALEEAKRITEVMRFGDLAERMIEALRPVLVLQLQQNHRVTPEQATAAVSEVFVPSMREAFARFTPMFEAITARHFTAAELRELRAFHESPVGQKSLSVMPQIMAEMQAIMGQMIPQIIQDTISRNREALRQRGLTL